MLKILGSSTWLNKRLWTNYLLNIFSFNYAGVFLLGVLLSRAVLLGELYPFGIGFMVGRCLYKSKEKEVALFAVILGAICTIKGWSLLGYLVSLLVLFAVFFCYNKQELSWLTIPVLIFSIHFLARGSLAFCFSRELYVWVEILFESVFVSVFAMVTVIGFQAYAKVTEGRVLTSEESTSLGLIILGVLVGVGGLVFLDCSFQSMLSRWLVLWGAFLGGPGCGAAIGAAVGLVPSIQGVYTVGPIAYYALAGLLGGVFNGFRKIGVVVGFVLGNVLLSFFFTESVEIVQALKETGVAVFIFLVFNLPVKREVLLASTPWHNNIGEELNCFYADKLSKIAHVFYELEKILRKEQEDKSDNNKVHLLFNKVASRVCTECSLKRVCWEQDFYKTYRAVLGACTKLETEGFIEEKDFGSDLGRRCLRLEDLSSAFNSQLEVLELANSYEKQLDTCHLMVNRQLTGLAKIVEDFSEEIKQKIEREETLESDLVEKLAEKGINVHELRVIKTPGGEKEIHITQDRCEQENWCVALVAPNVSQILERIYILKSRQCGRHKSKGFCSYVLVPSRVLQMTVGKAHCPKDGFEVSGDLCSALTLPNHKFALLMCDGMGVGPKAHAESSTALTILEKLLLAGFAPQTAVRTVNTALLLKTAGESFVTLDVVIINQINGQCDFIKIGGAPSLIRSVRGLEVVRSSSPPVGIVEKIETPIYRHLLGPRHNIILMSDGVWDVWDSADKAADRIEAVLAKFEVFDPQVVAEYLLYRTKQMAGACALDDMCVMVACLEKKD